MKPLRIYFRILQTGNGIYLKTKNEVNNLIVDAINRNPTKSASAIREIVLQEFKTNPASQQVLMKNERFFINSISAVEVFLTYLPAEQKPQDQFYTQWRFFQNSAPYRLVQYLDENKVVVYSEKTKVLHTVKLDKDTTVVADEVP